MAESCDVVEVTNKGEKSSPKTSGRRDKILTRQFSQSSHEDPHLKMNEDVTNNNSVSTELPPSVASFDNVGSGTVVLHENESLNPQKDNVVGVEDAEEKRNNGNKLDLSARNSDDAENDLENETSIEEVDNVLDKALKNVETQSVIAEDGKLTVATKTSPPVVIKRRIVTSRTKPKVTFKNVMSKVKYKNKLEKKNDYSGSKDEDDEVFQDPPVTTVTNGNEAESTDIATDTASPWQNIGARTFLNVAAVVANLMQTNYFKSQKEENTKMALRKGILRSNSRKLSWSDNMSQKPDPLEFLVRNSYEVPPKDLMAKNNYRLMYITTVLIAFPLGIFLGIVFSLIFNILT